MRDDSPTCKTKYLDCAAITRLCAPLPFSLGFSFGFIGMKRDGAKPYSTRARIALHHPERESERADRGMADATPSSSEADSLILHRWPAAWGLPSLSPECVAVETYLRMANLKFTCEDCKTPFSSPSGQLPALDQNADLVAREHVHHQSPQPPQTVIRCRCRRRLPAAVTRHCLQARASLTTPSMRDRAWSSRGYTHPHSSYCTQAAVLHRWSDWNNE